MAELRSITRDISPGCAVIYVTDDFKLTIEVITCRPFFLRRGPLMVRLRNKQGIYPASRCFRVFREVSPKPEELYER